MSAFFYSPSTPRVGTKTREELRTNPANNLASFKTGLGRRGWGGGAGERSPIPLDPGFSDFNYRNLLESKCYLKAQ